MTDQNSYKSTTRVYTPESPIANPRQLTRDIWADLLAGHELARRLAIRDISAQYRQTLLGWLWILIIPLSNTAVWIFLSAAKVVQVGATALPYPVYVFSGTLLWSIMIDSINAPLQQVNANKALLAKINFPRESLILSGIIQTLFSAAIKLCILGIVLPLLGVLPTSTGVLIPIGVISLVLVGTTIGLLLTPIGVLYGDIGKSIPLVTQFLMFLSPVVFPIPDSGWMAKLISMNPLTPVIVNARAWLTGQPSVFLFEWGLVMCVSVLLLFALCLVYRVAMPILIERMQS